MQAKRTWILFATLLLAVTVGHAQTRPIKQRPTAGSSKRASFQPRADAPKYAKDRLIVRFRGGTLKSHIEAAHAVVKARSIHTFRASGDLEVVRLPKGTQLEAALRFFRKDPAVLYAEPDYVVHTLQNPVTPDDPRFGELWGLQKIQAPQVWGITTGSPQVVVAVIDTGVDYNHQDLSANMFRNPLDCNSNGIDDDGNGYVDDCYGIDAANGDSNPTDDFGHGTHVAGTIGAAGNNGVGVVGVNWQVKLLACKFINSNGLGYTSDAIKCLDYVATMKERGVNIVATNNSWGGEDPSQALQDAIDAQRQRGILFITAAGNGASDNDSNPQYPASYDLPNVIAVAATNNNVNEPLAPFSNFGRHSVHLGAPGNQVLSTTPGNSYSVFGGTSMAAPHVTGVVALLKAADPSRDWRALRNLVIGAGDPLPSLATTISGRRLNAYGALTCNNQGVFSRLLPVQDAITLQEGSEITLAMMYTHCDTPAAVSLNVKVQPGAETIVLRDDGTAPDQAVGDGIFSATWVTPSLGSYSLEFPNGDVVKVTVPVAYVYSEVPFQYRQFAGTSLNVGDVDSVALNPPFPIRFGGASYSAI
jgi:thermitase